MKDELIAVNVKISKKLQVKARTKAIEMGIYYKDFLAQALEEKISKDFKNLCSTCNQTPPDCYGMVSDVPLLRGSGEFKDNITYCEYYPCHKHSPKKIKKEW